ncbi:MAG TPA: DUF4870 domain-containing protein [Candidatus Acidoferrum sp.]|nr:DUF4870 domain-containing protein [Candidatus Acidoferrum sp.]
MSASQPNAGRYVPTQDERTMALLAHILGIFAGFLAPLIFFLVKRDSKFVSFHALQSLAWHVIYFVLMMVGMAIFFINIFMHANFPPADKNAFPFAFFGPFIFVWLMGMCGWAVNLTLAVVYGVKANRGEWAQFPLIGGWILRNIVFT